MRVGFGEIRNIERVGNPIAVDDIELGLAAASSRAAWCAHVKLDWLMEIRRPEVKTAERVHHILAAFEKYCDATSSVCDILLLLYD